MVIDRSSKTKGLIYKIRPNACRHFKILCKLVLRPELVLRSSSYLFCKATHCATEQPCYQHCYRHYCCHLCRLSYNIVYISHFISLLLFLVFNFLSKLQNKTVNWVIIFIPFSIVHLTGFHFITQIFCMSYDTVATASYIRCFVQIYEWQDIDKSLDTFTVKVWKIPE